VIVEVQVLLQAQEALEDQFLSRDVTDDLSKDR
jgi:hypothetical protein